jgi:hypothetical protein
MPRDELGWYSCSPPRPDPTGGFDPGAGFDREAWDDSASEYAYDTHPQIERDLGPRGQYGEDW